MTVQWSHIVPTSKLGISNLWHSQYIYGHQQQHWIYNIYSSYSEWSSLCRPLCRCHTLHSDIIFLKYQNQTCCKCSKCNYQMIIHILYSFEQAIKWFKMNGYLLLVSTGKAFDLINFKSVYFMCFFHIFFQFILNLIMTKSACKKFWTDIALQLTPSLIMTTSHRVCWFIFLF